MSPRKLKNRPGAGRRASKARASGARTRPAAHEPPVEAVGAAMLTIDGSRRVLASPGWELLIGSPAPERIPPRGESEDDLLIRLGEAIDEAGAGHGPAHRVARIEVDRGRYYFISAGHRNGESDGRANVSKNGRTPVLVMEITSAFNAGPEEGEEIRQLAHDLRSPMTSMSGAAELLQSGRIGQVSPEQNKLLSLLRRGIQMSIELIDGATEKYQRAAGPIPGLEPVDAPSQEGR